MIDKIFKDILKDQKKTLALIAIVVVSALLVYVFFLLMPRVKRIALVRVKLAKMRADLKLAETDIAKMPSMKATVEAYKTKIGNYEKTLPTEEGIPGLLESLSEMAKNANMHIVGIVPVEDKEAKPQSRIYQEIPIMISAKAGFHELGRFMTSLENSDRFIKISDMQIKSNRASPKKHDVELLVTTYVLLEAK